MPAAQHALARRAPRRVRGGAVLEPAAVTGPTDLAESSTEESGMTPRSMRAALAAVFSRLDTDGDGLVSAETLCRYIKDHGFMTLPDNEIAALERLCSEAGGEMSLNEFETVFMTLWEDESPGDLGRCLMAEFVGMIIFQFLGGLPDAGGLGNALLAVGLIYTFANVSGAHFNPASTFAFWMSGQITLRKGVAYVTVEMVAAVVGAGLLKASGLHEVARAGARMCPAPRAGMTAWQVFTIESMCAFALFMLFMGAAVDPKASWGPIVPMVIGIMIYGLINAAGPLTGASVNPARLFGSGVAFGCLPGPATCAAYVLGALTGAGGAAWLYRRIFMDRPTSGLKSSEPARFKFMAFDIGRLRRRLQRHRKGAATPSSASRSTPSSLGRTDE